jgi:epoxyqueuosine reductase QueG
MQNHIQKLITDYVQKYQMQKDLLTSWREPLIAFAAADDQRFLELKKSVSATHALPEDFMADAGTVIAYFLPFEKSILDSNVEGQYSSREWVLAYLETNQLIADLNHYLNEECTKLGYKSSIIPATHNFDQERLISDWSHRHVAYIAGLGKFGLNKMLITAKGCGGRIGSVVTNMKIEPTLPDPGEYCLYKAKGTCQRCVQRCVGGALKADTFDRKRCYEMLMTNDQHNPHLSFADVCGKCMVNLPCTYANPLNSNKI